MEMREIMRHPFITKYLKEKKVGNDVLEEFRKVLSWFWYSNASHILYSTTPHIINLGWVHLL